MFLRSKLSKSYQFFSNNISKTNKDILSLTAATASGVGAVCSYAVVTQHIAERHVQFFQKRLTAEEKEEMKNSKVKELEQIERCGEEIRMLLRYD